MQRNLSKLEPKKWKGQMLNEMRGTHSQVKSTMSSSAPKNSGALAASIATQAWSAKSSGKDFQLNVRTGPRYIDPGRIWYAHFVELGSVSSSGKGFMKGTFDTYKETIARDIEKSLQKVIAKANGNA